jgi:hypothetical protein
MGSMVMGLLQGRIVTLPSFYANSTKGDNVGGAQGRKKKTGWGSMFAPAGLPTVRSSAAKFLGLSAFAQFP